MSFEGGGNYFWNSTLRDNRPFSNLPCGAPYVSVLERVLVHNLSFVPWLLNGVSINSNPLV